MKLVRDGNVYGSSFIIQDYFGSPEYFFSPYEVGLFSFKVCEELCLGFDGDCIESVDCFCKIAIFTMLVLPIQEMFPFSDIFFNFFLFKI